MKSLMLAMLIVFTGFGAFAKDLVCTAEVLVEAHGRDEASFNRQFVETAKVLAATDESGQGYEAATLETVGSFTAHYFSDSQNTFLEICAPGDASKVCKDGRESASLSMDHRRFGGQKISVSCRIQN